MNNKKDIIFNSITEIGDEKLCFENVIFDKDYDDDDDNVISILHILETFYQNSNNISISTLIKTILSKDNNVDFNKRPLPQNIELYFNRFFLPGYNSNISVPM